MAEENYDYTQEQAALDIDSYVVPAAVATKNADEIEAENSFDDIEPGFYELEVAGFDKLEPKRLELYVGESRYGIDAHQITVRLVLPNDKGKRAVDTFILPPNDPDAYQVWLNGSTQPPGKRGMCWSNKYFHFLERLFAITIPKGKPQPDETRLLRNWVGRKVLATIQPGRPWEKKVKDTNTGEDTVEQREGRNQIKMYSYRVTSPSTAGLMQPATPPAPQQQASPAKTNGQKPATSPTATAPAAQPARASVAQPAKPAVDPKVEIIATLNASLKEAVAAGNFAEAAEIQAELKKYQAPAAAQPAQARQPATSGAGAASRKEASLANL